ncbi:MAG: tetrahydrofolate dehydrogenase/cyclohydrolase catalytic domain-containing protein [Bacillota bacterium]|nr:tetrahydrofolate dehydrogenase/cyclohydrolase catalytic domain-containing protein [Bacillota bacterium]
MEMLSGKEIASEIKTKVREENVQSNIVPHLAIIVVGDAKENLLYIGLKQKAIEEVGGKTTILSLPASMKKTDLLMKIEDLNQDNDIHGILIQLPLPERLAPDQDEFLSAIHPKKDVDGFNPVNRGKLMGGSPDFISCAALACMEVVRRYFKQLEGKSVLLVGDSFDVIQPLALMFLEEKARVTVIPQYDPDLLKLADIAVIEKGDPLIVKEHDIKPGALLIDAGFYWYHDHLCGNIDREVLANVKGSLLPVPGGMGPILIAELMANLQRAAEGMERGNNG